MMSWITDGHADPVTAMTAQVPSSVAAVAASTAIDTVGRVQRRIERAITIDAAVPSSSDSHVRQRQPLGAVRREEDAVGGDDEQRRGDPEPHRLRGQQQHRRPGALDGHAVSRCADVVRSRATSAAMMLWANAG